VKSKLIRGIIIALIVVGVSFGGYYGYNTYFAKKTAVASTSRYLTVSAKKMNLEVNVQGTGAAYAGITKDVTPNNNGTLKGLAVKVGDTVTSGQKLFTSDSDDLRKNLTTAQTNLSKQSLTLSNDQSGEKVDANKIAMDNLSVSDAKTQLNYTNQQVNKMTVTAPIGGIVTNISSSEGDGIQESKPVLTIVDMNSIKIKVLVDELDISKVKIGQKANIRFDALKDKTYEGAVESIAQTGTTANNVTNYEVVVAVKKPEGIKLGMNANVNILVDSKEDALVIPAEALVTNNDEKFVRVVSTDSATTTQGTNGQAAQNNSAQATNETAKNEESAQKTQNGSQGQKGQYAKRNNSSANNGNQNPSSNGKLVPIKTGLENTNYIEVTEGLTEGEKVLVQLPSTSTSNKNNMAGYGSGFNGGSNRDMGSGRQNSGSTGAPSKN
jgi:HlyD family secretion protein